MVAEISPVPRRPRVGDFKRFAPTRKPGRENVKVRAEVVETSKASGARTRGQISKIFMDGGAGTHGYGL